MDTISRDSNSSSMLPVGGIIVGVLALLIGGYAAISLSKVNKALADMQPKIDKIDSVEASASAASAAADKAGRELRMVTEQTNAALKNLGDFLTDFQGRIVKVEEAQKKAPPPVASSKKGGGEPAVAGPGEYIVKSGDSGMKIAAGQGVSVKDLQDVNPGVTWTSLKPGQKLKLPAKR